MSNVLGPSDVLKQNEALWSSNRAYELRLQADGNLVVYRADTKQSVWNAWTSGRWMYPGQNLPATHLTMEPDGNLVLYGAQGPLWDTDTHGPMNTRCCVMQDDGNLAVREIGMALWASAMDT